MSEENQSIDEELNPELSGSEIIEEEGNRITRVSGMYQDYFLDYASYVILERAVPALNDGLKPVQRRLLHAMKEMDDGRFHKVANIIWQTMRFHPHGDASIGDALVQMGQKDLLIDCQGNWGNILTGDGAARQTLRPSARPCAQRSTTTPPSGTAGAAERGRELRTLRRTPGTSGGRPASVAARRAEGA